MTNWKQIDASDQAADEVAEDLSSVLGPARGYTDLLDDVLKAQAQAEVEAPRKYNPLRPSNAGKCPRKLAFELAEYRLGWKYTAKPLDPKTMRLFRLGSAIEFEAIKDFQKLPGYSVKYRQQVVDVFDVERGNGLPPERIEGSLDWVLWSASDRVLMDAKSRKERFINKYASNWKTEIAALKKMDTVVTLSATAVWVPELKPFMDELGWHETLSENCQQINLYGCSKFCVDRNIDKASVYRVNKNTSEHAEVRFAVSTEVRDMTKTKFDRVSMAVDAGRPEDIAPEHAPGWSFCDCMSMTRLK